MESWKAEFVAAAERADVLIRELMPEEAGAIKRIVEMKFAGRRRSPLFLWEYLIDRLAVHDPHAWEWIGEFVGNDSLIFFFDHWNGAYVFEFEDGSKLVPVLEDSYWSEFYLTDRVADYLICYSDHDILYATGTASDWLKERLSREGRKGYIKS